MDIYQIIQDLSSAIAADDAVSAWSVITYNRECQIFENIDAREPPLPDACPLIVFFPVKKLTGTDQPQKQVTIAVSLLVYEDEKPESLDGVISFTAGRHAEELRQLVLARIISTLKDSGILHLENIDMDYNSIDQYPYSDITMTLTITAEQVIGGDFYE